MRFASIIFLAALAVAQPAQAATVDEAVNTIMALCAGSGERLTISGGAGAGAQLSLKKFDAQGHLNGDIRITKTQAQGLVDGLQNQMNSVTAQQADHLRACIAPYRERIMELILGPPKHSDADQSHKLASNPKPPDHVLYMECRFATLPTKYPPSGRVWSHTFFNSGQQNGLEEMYGPPGAEMGKINDGYLKQTFECAVTNYSSEPVHDVLFYMPVKFEEAHWDVDQPGSIRSGPVADNIQFLAWLDKLDPGKDSPFQFYITNASPYFVSFALPDEAVGLTLENSKIIFRVSHPVQPPIGMSPGQEVH